MPAPEPTAPRPRGRRRAPDPAEQLAAKPKPDRAMSLIALAVLIVGALLVAAGIWAVFGWGWAAVALGVEMVGAIVADVL